MHRYIHPQSHSTPPSLLILDGYKCTALTLATLTALAETSGGACQETLGGLKKIW
jgi:hypothetical protein